MFNPTKNDKIQITDTTIIRSQNEGKYLLQKWNIIYSDINGNGKLNKIIKPTKTSSPLVDSGATSTPPVGNSIVLIETSLGQHGNNFFCQFRKNRRYPNY